MSSCLILCIHMEQMVSGEINVESESSKSEAAEPTDKSKESKRPLKKGSIFTFLPMLFCRSYVSQFLPLKDIRGYIPGQFVFDCSICRSSLDILICFFIVILYWAAFLFISFFPSHLFQVIGWSTLGLLYVLKLITGHELSLASACFILCS